VRENPQKGRGEGCSCLRGAKSGGGGEKKGGGKTLNGDVGKGKGEGREKKGEKKKLPGKTLTHPSEIIKGKQRGRGQLWAKKGGGMWVKHKRGRSKKRGVNRDRPVKRQVNGGEAEDHGGGSVTRQGGNRGKKARGGERGRKGGGGGEQKRQECYRWNRGGEGGKKRGHKVIPKVWKKLIQKRGKGERKW